MSLNSLRSFSGAASFATTAFDTARTTFKAMADAAVPPAGSDAAGTAPGERRAEAEAVATADDQRTPAAAAEPAGVAERSPAEKRKSGMRKGIALDAYA